VGPGRNELMARLALTDCFADLGSWSWDPEFDRLDVSERFMALLGLEQGEDVTIGHALRAMPDEDATHVRSALDALAAGDLESCRVDYRLHGVDGSVHWLEGHCHAVRSDTGGLQTVLGLSRDVSERVHSDEEALRARHELESARDYLRAVTDTMDESMFTLDPAGYVQYVNPAAERLLGWSTGELVGQLMHDVSHSRRPDGTPYPIEQCPIMSARAQGQIVHVKDDVFIRRDGSDLPVSYTALPFSTDAGVEGCVVIFEDVTARRSEEERIQRDRDKLAWATRIREALAEDRFELYAQPIVDCASRRVVQRELLLRLQDPELGTVTPAAFLPVAEELGLIREIDRWVIGRAAVIAHDLGAVEVNVSALSIGDPLLVDHIANAIERAGADPGSIVFEITETAIVGDEAAARSFLDRLHRLGCRVALDDFGTGYGSFTHLKQLPIDILKIDVEFVSDLLVDPASRRVVEAVVSLAKGFGLETIGEGVEDEQTYRQLVALGVDKAQGFHLGVPLPLGGEEAGSDGGRALGQEPARDGEDSSPAASERASSIIAGWEQPGARRPLRPVTASAEGEQGRQRERSRT
jgi:PAS domain S-box-containing protein